MSLNQVLMKVYRDDVALKEDLTKNCVKTVTEFIPYFLECMKQSDDLFNLLFKEVFYGGSYYDDLKISEATEFDLNIVIRLPIGPDNLVFNQSIQPGFVSIGLRRPFDSSLFVLELAVTYGIFQNFSETPEYALHMKIGNFFHDQTLMPEKLRNWFEGVCVKAVNQQTSDGLRRFNIQYLSLKKSGPALTLEIQSPHLPEINIDLVPVIRKGHVIYDDNMFCVPKSHTRDPLLWRCSYPMMERYILKNGGCAKVVIKLLKKMRDKQGWHNLASYYLKTVVMLTKKEKHAEYDEWEENKLGEYYIQTLESLSSYLSKGFLPFYHDHRCNLIERIHPETLFNINGHLRRIINDFKQFRQSKPAEVKKKYF